MSLLIRFATAVTQAAVIMNWGGRGRGPARDDADRRRRAYWARRKGMSANRGESRAPAQAQQYSRPPAPTQTPVNPSMTGGTSSSEYRPLPGGGTETIVEGNRPTIASLPGPGSSPGVNPNPPTPPGSGTNPASWSMPTEGGGSMLVTFNPMQHPINTGHPQFKARFDQDSGRMLNDIDSLQSKWPQDFGRFSFYKDGINAIKANPSAATKEQLDALEARLKMDLRGRSDGPTRFTDSQEAESVTLAHMLSTLQAFGRMPDYASYSRRASPGVYFVSRGGTTGKGGSAPRLVMPAPSMPVKRSISGGSSDVGPTRPGGKPTPNQPGRPQIPGYSPPSKTLPQRPIARIPEERDSRLSPGMRKTATKNMSPTPKDAIRNAFKTDEQRKAYWAGRGGGGHGGGTAHGASAAKAHEAGFEDKMAKAFEMGLGLGKDMLGGLGVAGEAGAIGKNADRINKLRDFFRKVAADAPEMADRKAARSWAERYLLGDAGGYTGTEDGFKATMAKVDDMLAQKGDKLTQRELMDEAQSIAIDPSSARYEPLKQVNLPSSPQAANQSKAAARKWAENYLLGDWGGYTTGQEKGFKETMSRVDDLIKTQGDNLSPRDLMIEAQDIAIRNRLSPRGLFFMLNRAPLTEKQKRFLHATGSGRGGGGGGAQKQPAPAAGSTPAPTPIDFDPEATRQWNENVPGNEQAKRDRQNMEIEAGRLRAGQSELNRQTKERAKKAWAAYEQQRAAGEEGKPNPKADRLYDQANAIERSIEMQTSYQQRYDDVRRMADAIHANRYISPDGQRYRSTAIPNSGPMTDEQRRAMFASRARGGNNIAPRGGTAPATLRRDGNNIAAPPGGGPTVVTSVLTGPNSTVHRTTKTGFPRAPVQPGGVTGPIPDQLSKPRLADQFGPGDQGGRNGGQPPPPAPVRDPRETDRQFNQRQAEWEKKYSPDHQLGLLGGGTSAPGAPGSRDAEATRKMADQIRKKAAQKKESAASKVQNPSGGVALYYPGRPPAKAQPVLSDAARRFAALPVQYGSA